MTLVLVAGGAVLVGLAAGSLAAAGWQQRMLSASALAAGLLPLLAVPLLAAGPVLVALDVPPLSPRGVLLALDTAVALIALAGLGARLHHGLVDWRAVGRTAARALVIAVAVAGASLVASGVQAAAELAWVLPSVTGGAVALLWTGRRPAPAEGVDERLTAVLEGTRGQARETLVALDRLTDPLTVEQHVIEALRGLLPGARLELYRARHAPTGSLPSARELPSALLPEVIAQGFLVRERAGLSPKLSEALSRLGGRLLVAVRCGATMYGALLLDTTRIDHDTVVTARRFADLLAYKLETHRLYAEVEHKARLATVGSFAAALAHDLRTPLTSIRMNVQILRRHGTRLGSDAEYLDIALEEVDALNQQIAELLDFTRPIALDSQRVDVADWIEGAAAAVQGLLADRQVGLRRDLAPELPDVVGDPIRLRRALVNLLSNAAVAAPRGSEVVLRARRVGDELEVAVRDRGPGIDAKDLPRLFEPFFTTKPDGTGLGLAITHKVIEAHRGTLTADSRIGAGAELTIRLPATH